MKVLLHGAEAAARKILFDILLERDHEVHVSGDGDELTALVREHMPDMIVLVPSEQDLIERLRSVRSVNPFGLLVAAGVPASPALVHDLFENGVDDVILASHRPERLSARFGFIEESTEASPGVLMPKEKEKEARQQQAVAEIGRRALSGTQRMVLMAVAARTIAGVMGVEYCKVLRHLPEQGMFVLKAGTGWREGIVGQSCVEDGKHSQAGYTLHSPDPVVVDDITTEDRFEAPALLIEHGVRAGISVVIPSTPEQYGILGVHTMGDRQFSEDDVYFLQSVANVLAGAVERSRTEQALNDSEARVRAILETTVDAIITIDEEGVIESFNEAAEDIFGYDDAEVIGQNVKVLMPQPYREEHDGYMRSYRDTGRRRIIGIGREVTGLRKDGSTFPMDLAVSEVQLESRRIFTGIIRDISERRRLETEILDISEQERRRIGQDLHDGLGQMLTGIGLLSQNLTRQLNNENHPLASESDEITSLMKEADQYARDLARGLTPVDLDADGLSQALQRLSDNAVRLFDVDCLFEEVDHPKVHDSTAATHMYRIAQEAVSNAVRHGDASSIKILLAAGPKQTRLRVRDDGTGFDRETVDGPGMGLHIMNYRARIIGGTLEINTNLGEGTVVTCTLPWGTQRSGDPADASSDSRDVPSEAVLTGDAPGEGRAGSSAATASNGDPSHDDKANGTSSTGTTSNGNRTGGGGCPFHSADE